MAVVTTCYEYDGTNWTASGVGTITAAANGVGLCGTQTAGLCMGGHNGTDEITTTQEYNGSAWSSGGALATKVQGASPAGTQTAGLEFGGYNGVSTYLNKTEEYDGSSWSSGGNLGTAKQAVMGFGSLNDGVCAGGDTGSYVSVVEVYNGTAWSVGNALSAVRGAGATSGTSTSAGGFVAGGYSGSANLNTMEECAGAVAAKSVTSS